MDSPRKKIITGKMDGLPIWRWQTDEEMLLDAGIAPEVADLYIALNERKHG